MKESKDSFFVFIGRIEFLILSYGGTRIIIGRPRGIWT